MIFNLRSLPGPWSAVIIKHISKNSHAYFGSLQKLEKMLIYKGPLFIGQRLRDCSRTPNYGIRGFMKAKKKKKKRITLDCLKLHNFSSYLLSLKPQ